MIFLLAGLIVLSVASLFVGVSELRISDLWQDRDAIGLLLISRLPRTCAVLITGAVLAIAGTILQGIVRNRFVEPMTTGTGQGAALGILIATIFIPDAPLIVRMCVAAVTALTASLGFIAIAGRMPPTQPILVALVGLIYGGLIAAAVTFVAYQLDMLQYIEIWITGEFSGVLQGRYELLWVAAGVGLLVYLIADQLAIVGMGRTAAINLGLNYRQVMMLGLLAVSIVTSLTVVTVGMIPFVGLVVPNIISRWLGDNMRRALPVVALMGAGLVLVSDILGRIMRAPFEIPASTVFGIFGALVFIALLYMKPRHA